MAIVKAVKKTIGKRVNKKHFIIFNNGGIISATTPKDWARAHQKFFNKYNFSDSDNTPTVGEIEKYLLNKESFSRIENNEIIILYQYLNL